MGPRVRGGDSGGTRYSWTSPMILALVASSSVLSVLFVARLYRAPEPFLPLAVLNNQVMRMGTTAASLAMGTSIGLTIFVPLYFEVVHKLSATESGLALIPLALTTPGSLLSGQAMLYWRHYKLAPIIGLVFGLIAAIIACYRGLNTEGGTRGVGNSTTWVVVASSISIFIADFFLTKLFITISK